MIRFTVDEIKNGSKGLKVLSIKAGHDLFGKCNLIAKETKISTQIIEDPVTAVARGAGMVLENLDELREVLSQTEELEPPR